jgi:hypothetical protein
MSRAVGLGSSPGAFSSKARKAGSTAGDQDIGRVAGQKL